MTPVNPSLLSHQAIFVGWEAEMALLSAALEDACTGQGGVVLLAGEPGIGTTRTAEELGLRRPNMTPRYCGGVAMRAAGRRASGAQVFADIHTKSRARCHDAR